MGSPPGPQATQAPMDITTEQQLPEWVQNAGKENYGLAQDIASRPWEQYGGERVAGFTGDQQTAFDQTRGFATTPNQGVSDAGALMRMFAGAGPNTIGFQPSVGGGMGHGGMGHNGGPPMTGGPMAPPAGGPSTGGPAAPPAGGPSTGGPAAGPAGGMPPGGFQTGGPMRPDGQQPGGGLAGMFGGGTRQPTGVPGVGAYMNPYVQNVLGGTLDRIRESGQMQRNQIGAAATMGGAFGDARHGVADATQMRDEGILTRDTVNQGLSSAFGNAQQLQQADLARQQQAGMFNAGQMDGALSRMFQGAQGLQGNDAAGFSLSQAKAGALLGTGGLQQQNRQAVNDVNYTDFLGARDWDLRNLNILTNALAATPYNKTQHQYGYTTQVTQPQGGGALGGLGGAIGGILGGIF